ncbi:MAG: DTW domain-containing protein [Colwelliaceae bacterium]|nr:DTW domain-containing protein [Colwelliaceae bacterium]
MHAVNRLLQYRKSLSTTEYKSRGQRLIRCELCQLGKENCICSLKINLKSNVGFLLLMYDTEVLKPSNTGKLIADLIPETYAFLWSRTVIEQEIVDIIKDEKWQPYIVFPSEFAKDNQQVFHQEININKHKKPLFIMLDGSWREAKKMFRKSPYLAGLPLLSINPQSFISEDYLPKYQLRNSGKINHLCTAEVAAQVLTVAGEPQNANILDCWFDLYSYQYQKSVCQTNKGDATSQDRFKTLVDLYK